MAWMNASLVRLPTGRVRPTRDRMDMIDEAGNREGGDAAPFPGESGPPAVSRAALILPHHFPEQGRKHAFRLVQHLGDAEMVVPFQGT